MDNERDRIESIMRDLAAGDNAALASLYFEFGERMAPMVRRRLAQLGVHNPERDDMTGLVIDACFEIKRCAGGWDPAGGAKPWNWAAQRINSMVAKSVGVFADPLDDAFADGLEEPASTVATGADGGAFEVLTGMARADPKIRLLLDAFDVARVSDRDRAVTLEYALQRSMGDTSPAVTVSDVFGLRHDHVRQIFRRTRTRLIVLSERDPRFASLRGLLFVAP
jgi:hypothetical protein